VVETTLARLLSHLNTESSVYLGFDAPTLIFYRFRSDLRGFPSCTAACSIVANRTGASWTSPHLQSLCSNSGPILTEPPLLGFVHGLPRCRHSLVRPLLELPKQLTRPTDANQQVSFRSRGFSPPQRLPPYASSQHLAMCCQPGFAMFRRMRPISVGRTYLITPSLLPITHSPPEEFPSSAAVPHHCGRYPLAVLSHRVRSERRSA